MFCELNKLGPPQVGHFTCLGLADGSLMGYSWVTHGSLTRFKRACPLRAERHFKGRVFFAGKQFAIGLLLHEANDHQQTVATDFWREIQAVVDAQAKQLKVATLWQILLQLATCCHDLLGAARFTHHFENELNGFGQWRKVL